MSLTAYVRYDNTGRIVPGGPIVTSIKPKVGDWVAVDDVLTTTPNYKLRGFIRYIKNGDYVAGSLILQHNEPQDGNWKEVYVLNPACCATTTTTTTIHYYYYSGDNCISPLFSQVIRSLVSLSINDVVLTDDGACYTINSTYVGPGYSVEYVSTEACFTAPCPTTTTSTSTSTTTTSSTSTTTTSTTIPPPVTYYYNVTGYSCGDPCNNVGPFTAQSTTPLTIGLFYNNPENRGYSFEILEEIAPTLGGYDLSGEPGYALCTDACP